jgi:DNA-binding transcriptional LysR family regulator
MRTTHLRQADLNLLIVFTVLAEERNVTRAAARLSLSQPAASRALQRLRDMFHDDLLIRTSSGYQPTPKGERLLHELESTLPRLDRLLSGKDFDPAAEETSFQIATTDHASHVLCPLLCRTVLAPAGKISFHFMPLHDGTFEAMEKARIDLVLNADDGYAPAHLAKEAIFEVEFVCVVAKESRFSRAFTLKQYLAADHIGIGVLRGIQTIPEKRLAAVGAERHCPIWVPYHTAAMRSVAGTNLVATVPRRMAELEASNPAIKILKAPAELEGFNYLMIWHPRMNTDAAHVWLRSIVREAGKHISLEVTKERPQLNLNR